MNFLVPLVSGDFLPELRGMPAARPCGISELWDADGGSYGCSWGLCLSERGDGEACTEELDLRKALCEARYCYCYMWSLAEGLKNWNRYLWTLCLLDELFVCSM